ncbi:hypothetical protein P5G51_005345 [Virgibacillus sp. 179-BFC.A HS]|uniref:Uncharacterized protein n=1 Tax=Tigheibacillus jepli TaxID=3035914 RepID=A0ABU5CFA9_9BACI|nr:hypothetical protein [Virgibacillus sp. 179-BFC.A HS]MDY0404900.1 hypothetical protein [Virgibacillus sp. 179-BFC.A HS]
MSTERKNQRTSKRAEKIQKDPNMDKNDKNTVQSEKMRYKNADEIYE